MWVGHFHLSHDNCIYLTKCNKFKVAVSVYPLNIYTENNFIYYTNINVLSGSEEGNKKLINAFKKDKRTQKLEVRGNQFVTFLKMEKTDYHTISQYNKKMFFLQPIIHDNEYEDWLIGSWDKNILTNFYSNCKKLFNIKMLGITQEKTNNLFLPKRIPKLTKKQVEAIELAITQGYYDFPKKIYLSDLAKKLGISRVSFQEHLKKAESKLLPLLLGSIATEQ